MSNSIVHNDEATQNDGLNRNQYAKALARVAETCDTPLVIGLYGSWGMGKTSLMKLIEAHLDGQSNRTVWFDPWQHQFDESPAVALLHTMVDTFQMQEKEKKTLFVIAVALGSILLNATTKLNYKDLKQLNKQYEEERFQLREARIRIEACKLREDLEHLQSIDFSQGDRTDDLVSIIQRDRQKRAKL